MKRMPTFGFTAMLPIERYRPLPPYTENAISIVCSSTPDTSRPGRRLTGVSIANLPLDDRRLAEVCRRYGIGRLDIFGSVSRGEAAPGSDVNVLYELAPGARLGWEIENLADELTQVLSRRVDLVSRAALHERLRDTVLAEAQLLYAA